MVMKSTQMMSPPPSLGLNGDSYHLVHLDGSSRPWAQSDKGNPGSISYMNE